MNSKLSNFLIKISPTSTLRRRMRFFANRAMDKFDESDGKDEDIKQMIFICRFWANEILRRKPNDDEAKMYEHFPDSMPK